MEIIFNVDYHTVWGQILYITGSLPSLGDFDPNKAVPMHYKGVGKWAVLLELPDEQASFEYHYLVKEYDVVTDREWGGNKKFQAAGATSNYVIYDHWVNQPAETSFYSSAFTKGVLARIHPDRDQFPDLSSSITLRLFAPRVRPDQVVAVVGNTSGSGKWDVLTAKVMTDAHFPEWTIHLDPEEMSFPFYYKFVILKKESLQLIAWEDGDNRVLDIERPKCDESLIFAGMRLRNPLPRWKGAGVAVPVFSLRSQEGFGIGEFKDIKKMADWAVKTGQRFIQLLPINDTTMTHTWVDSYPYNANSTFALNPVYLNLESMGRLNDRNSMAEYAALRDELNRLPDVDFERVALGKRKYCETLFNEQGTEVLNSDEFHLFFNDNKSWLVPYAAYNCLRDIYETPDFRNWKMYSVYNREDIEEFCAKGNIYYEQVAICYFIQYHLYKQMKEAHDYIASRGLVLKGDIPIGISPNSVDAWTYPDLFNLNSQAGAPPDDFSVTGQNWGFPTYNWDKMAEDGYAWWKSRFRNMAIFFDAYRIDHILGFFRIWEIPESSVQGLLGHFSPALPYSMGDLHSYGFYFDENRHNKPFIRHYFLSEIFGEYAGEVIHSYLNDVEYGAYNLKPEIDTQRKIEHFFKDKSDEKSRIIRDGLYALTEEVLFVEDPCVKSHFHPRISCHNTFSYKAMSDYERWCFDRLYVDFFYHRHNDFWRNEALKKLPPLISATSMLVCGEDLGMIPQCVPDVMHQLEILTLEIQRMPKDPAREFTDTASYPYLSVCSTSTHDMPTLRSWWEENREKTQRYYNYILHQSGEPPYFCEPWICSKIIDLHLQSPSMLVILPLQDWLSMDGALRREDPSEERINVPATPRYYWKYRMHLTLEELLLQDAFNHSLQSKIKDSGR